MFELWKKKEKLIFFLFIIVYVLGKLFGLSIAS